MWWVRLVLKPHCRADYLDQTHGSVDVVFEFASVRAAVLLRAVGCKANCDVRAVSSTWLVVAEMLLVVGGVGGWAAWELRNLRREALRREPEQKSKPDEPVNSNSD